MTRRPHSSARTGLAVAFGLLAGCGGPDRPPPPPLSFEGLPVSGSLNDALNAGFTSCWEDTTELRCRRGGVMLLGQGPFNAALNLNGSNGGGGFDELLLWHDRDQNAAIRIARALEREGWRSCFTGEGFKGNQAIYTRQDTSVRISMDLSYWGKRRLRVLPDWNDREPRC